MCDRVEQRAIDYNSDRPPAEHPVKIEDLTLRDGHQSLFATRGRTEDMIPVAEMMDEIGFWAVEVWGGATFDTMHRFLNEDPWERIRTLKRYFKKTPLSMLLRAQNLVGYRNYADDVAEAFVARAAENGMDFFRTFDALNDYRNFETVVRVIKGQGKHFQGCICYSLTEPRLGGDVYNLDYYVGKARELESMGADTICLKDMAGLIAPYDAYAVVKALKENCSLPIHLHSHFTSGMSPMSQLKAIEAGVDIVDTCMSPYAYRTSHPALEPLVMSLLGTNRDTGFDIQKLAAVNEVLERDICPKYRHLLDDTRMSMIDINVLLHQTPGGMLSNLVNQLRQMDALDRIDEVYRELPRVRRELGQIPLVTPTSQIVGIQTVNNVLFDSPEERYRMITDQVKDLCYGLYGKTAVPIDREVQQKALKGYARGDVPITGRPAEVLEPELEKAKQETEGLAKDLEDVLTCALYPVTGRKFLKWKYGIENPPKEVFPRTLEDVRAEQELVQKAKAGQLIEKARISEKGEYARTFRVFVDDEPFEVSVEETNGDPPIRHAGPPVDPVRVTSGDRPSRRASSGERATPEDGRSGRGSVREEDLQGTPLRAPMPGMVVRYEKGEGDAVNKGDTVLVLEAMKMENALPAPADGTVLKILFSAGDEVARQDILCVIG